MAIITLPTPSSHYSNGATAIGTEVRADLNTIVADYNGGIQNANLAANSAIADSHLSQISTAGKVNGSALTLLGNIPGAAGIIPIANMPTGGGGGIITTTSQYVFTCSATFSTVPTVSSTYVDSVNAGTFTVVYAVGNILYATGSVAPGTSGTLTKSAGTGDSPITYSSVGYQLGQYDTLVQRVQQGVVTAAANFTISSLVAGAKYKLVFNFNQNTANSVPTLRFNADSGANYKWSIDYTTFKSNADTSITMAYVTWYVGEAHGEINIQPSYSSNNIALINFGTLHTYTTSPIDVWGGGSYSGAAPITSLTLLTSAGTMTGTWSLYQLS